MKINLDGTIDIDEGEILPYICPTCHWPITYDEKLFMVRCTHCNYIGTKEEFDNEFTEINGI